MRTFKIGPPPQLPANAGPYLQALDVWMREFSRQLQLLSEENDRTLPHAYVIGTMGTSTVRTLTGTATSVGEVEGVLRTLIHDFQKRGVVP